MDFDNLNYTTFNNGWLTYLVLPGSSKIILIEK